jgi:hypothetical protein
MIKLTGTFKATESQDKPSSKVFKESNFAKQQYLMDDDDDSEDTSSWDESSSESVTILIHRKT